MCSRTIVSKSSIKLRTRTFFLCRRLIERPNPRAFCLLLHRVFTWFLCCISVEKSHVILRGFFVFLSPSLFLSWSNFDLKCVNFSFSRSREIPYIFTHFLFCISSFFDGCSRIRFIFQIQHVTFKFFIELKNVWDYVKQLWKWKLEKIKIIKSKKNNLQRIGFYAIQNYCTFHDWRILVWKNYYYFF